MQRNPVDQMAEKILAGTEVALAPATIERELKSVEMELNAIGKFFYKWRNSPHTLRRYQTEIARLWLWASDQHLMISQLTDNDLERYEEFLADPQPRSRWCSGRKYPRGSVEWRPFVSGLSITSTNHAFNAIRALFTVWLKSGYIHSDPMANKARIGSSMNDGVDTSSSAAVESKDRWFDDKMAQAIKQALAAMPDTSASLLAKRSQYTLIIRTLTVTGARVSELVHAKQSQVYEDRSGWWIKLRGKGGKLRTVPLPVDYITGVLMPWRESHGLPRIPAAEELTPLCPPRKWVEGKSGLNSRMVLDIVKSTAKMAATLMPPEAQRATALLQKASNHWFRHTFITALIDDNVPVKTILTTVGQSSEQTLRIYDHKQDNDRHVDVTRVASKL
jgi:site-specific recombinase XerD